MKTYGIACQHKSKWLAHVARANYDVGSFSADLLIIFSVTRNSMYSTEHGENSYVIPTMDTPATGNNHGLSIGDTVKVQWGSTWYNATVIDPG